MSVRRLRTQLKEAQAPHGRRSPNVKMVTFGLSLDTFGRLRHMATHLHRPYQELMRELITIGLWQLEERESRGKTLLPKAHEVITEALSERDE